MAKVTMDTARTYMVSRFRSGVSRVRGASVPNLQAAFAATLAYVLLRYIIRQDYPVFGAVACYLALGFSRNRQPRRVLEIGLGASFGVLIGEVVATTLGFGWWQLLLILLVTPLWARFIDRSDLMTFQTAINAMVVASMSTMALDHHLPHSPTGRWIDALVGALVALFAAVLLPASITTRPRRQTSVSLVRLAEAMDAIGDGLGRGDARQVNAAQGYLVEARDLLTEARASQSSADDIAALNPAMRSERTALAELDRLLGISGRLHVSLSMLARQGRSHAAELGPSPVAGAMVTEGATALRHLGHAVGHWNKPVLARSELTSLARELAPLEVAEGRDWRTTALVSTMRAVVVDLLQLTGLSLQQARALLVEAPVAEVKLPLHEGSDVWGTATMPAVGDE